MAHTNPQDLPSGNAPLSLRLFGTVEVQRQGIPLPRTSTRKELWLLALLVLRHKQPTPRSLLAGILWPDSQEHTALYNLRRSLTDLRHVLGDDAHRLLSPTPRTLQMNTNGMDIDVLAFDEAVKHEDAVSLNTAVMLYRGPLLEGCTEDWATPERVAREQACLHALELLAAKAREQGDRNAEIGFLCRLLAVDPYRESALCALMTACAEKGDYAQATALYRDFRLRLHAELNSEPEASTTSLYRSLRDSRTRPTPFSRVSLSPSVALSAFKTGNDFPSNLPLPVTSFIGREKEMGEVKGLLEKTRLLTLTGSGGSGKTRLSQQVAGDIVPAFPEGVWLVELAAVTDPGLVTQAVAAVLGVREQVGESLQGTLMASLKGKCLLLLLDNCEHLVSACGQLATAMLRSCPDVRILATSRERLGIAGELTYRVPSLTLPDLDQPLTPESLMVSESVRLFRERTLFHKPDFMITDENTPVLAQLCHRLDGIPLALELAAARVRSLSVEDINGRLDSRFRLLTGGDRSALPRQQTLRALVDWSYDLLTEREKVLLARLSTFAGGWTLEAAEAVCGSDSLEAWEMLDLLTGLLDKSLVLIMEENCWTRYWMLVLNYKI